MGSMRGRKYAIESDGILWIVIGAHGNARRSGFLASPKNECFGRYRPHVGVSM